MAETFIKVSIIDDHPVVLNGIQLLFTNRQDMQLVGRYTTASALFEGLERNPSDVLLLDIKLSDIAAEDLAAQLADKFPKMKVIALTYLDTVYYVKLMMRHGVQGYLLKTATEKEVVEAICQVYNGGRYIDHSLQERILQHTLLNKKATSGTPTLSRREREILQLMASNYSSQEIARKLFLSKRTVENHRANMLSKFKVKNSVSLIKKAIELELLD